MEDKRSTPRRRRRYRVTVGPASWFTTDVGEGGFGAETARALAPGTVVSGLIHGKASDGRELEVPFTGLVAWAVRGNMHINMRSRTGVRFTRVAPTVAALLEDHAARAS
jgi:hypothetical protein